MCDSVRIYSRGMVAIIKKVHEIRDEEQVLSCKLDSQLIRKNTRLYTLEQTVFFWESLIIAAVIIINIARGPLHVTLSGEIVCTR